MPMRMVYGTVGYDSKIIGGLGFSVANISEGKFQITFSKPYVHFYSVNVTQWAVNSPDLNTRDNALFGFPTKEGFTVFTGDQNGKLVNRGFSFIATGHDDA